MSEAQRVFSFGRRPEVQCTERQELLQSLAATRVQINQAYRSFDTAHDPELVESFVYEINALQSRYSYLLRRIKELTAEEEAYVAASNMKGGRVCPS